MTFGKVVQIRKVCNGYLLDKSPIEGAKKSPRGDGGEVVERTWVSRSYPIRAGGGANVSGKPSRLECPAPPLRSVPPFLSLLIGSWTHPSELPSAPKLEAPLRVAFSVSAFLRADSRRRDCRFVA